MTDPLAAIAADAAAAAVPVAEPSRFMRLLQPSPRSDADLQNDLLARLTDDLIDARWGAPIATESLVGEAVVDCVYAVAGASGGMGSTSPLARLGRSAVAFLGRLRNLAAKNPKPKSDGIDNRLP